MSTSTPPAPPSADQDAFEDALRTFQSTSAYAPDAPPDTDLLPDAGLPSDWRVWPWPTATQQIGTFWHERRASVALSVPSAVIPMQRKVLLNIQHPRFADLAIDGPFPFPANTRLV